MRNRNLWDWKMLRPLQINFLFPVLGMASSCMRAGGNFYYFFKQKGSRLQEICTLTGTGTSVDAHTTCNNEFTERHPVVAELNGSSVWEQRSVYRRAQQHVRHLPWKRGRIAAVNCRLRVCDVIKRILNGRTDFQLWGCGRWTGNRKFIWSGLTRV